MSEDIERLSRRRRVMLSVYGISFLAFQSLFFAKLDDPIAMWRPIHYALAAGYLGWSATLIYVLATGGFLFRGRSAEARAALNDELTVANRRNAYRAGYWMMMGSALLLWVLSRFTTWSEAEVLRMIFAFGVAMPAVSFAGWERKQGA